MPKKQLPERTEPLEPEAQQSHQTSIAKEEELKRIITRHPQRDIPRVESVEPSEAPSKE
jgi:hypothetical protein